MTGTSPSAFGRMSSRQFSGVASSSAESTSYSLNATTEVWDFLSNHRLT